MNDNNTLVSFSNDNDLTSLIKASVGDSPCTLQNISHDETNLTKQMGSRLNKKIEVKFQISCGTYLSNYAALVGKGNTLEKLIISKIMLKKQIIHMYVTDNTCFIMVKR